MITEDLKNSLLYCHTSGNFYWVGSGNREMFDKIGTTTKKHHSGKTYMCIYACGEKHLAHRLAWALYYGNFPEFQIDHIDGNGLNNAILNLREVKQRENHRNVRLKSSNTSGVCGLSWDKRRSKWSVKIGVDGETINLGRRPDFFEACCLRKSAERKYGFHRNHGSRRPL